MLLWSSVIAAFVALLAAVWARRGRRSSSPAGPGPELSLDLATMTARCAGDLADLFGVSASFARIAEAVHQEDRDVAAGLLATALAHGHARQELRLRTPDGAYKWFAVTARADHGTGAVVVYAHDVTAARQTLQGAYRQGLARDLHDHVAQDIAAARGVLDLLDSDDQRLALLAESLDAADTHLRGLMRRLRAGDTVDFDGGSLADDLAEQAAWLRGQLPGADVVCQNRLSETELPGAVEHAARLVLAEAVRNAAEHSRATAVLLAARVHGQQLTLTVQDNGRGIAQPAPDGHWGVQGMTERAADAGGRLRVTAPPGGGTRVELVVALPQVVFSRRG